MEAKDFKLEDFYITEKTKKAKIISQTRLPPFYLSTVITEPATGKFE